MNDQVIDPSRDRVWAVEVTFSYTTYVVAETAAEAEQIAEDKSDEDQDLIDDALADCVADEVTNPRDLLDDGDSIVPWGRSRWEDHELTVNEAVELIASRKPVYDTQTILMPFADSPPPIHPRPDEDVAAGRQA